MNTNLNFNVKEFFEIRANSAPKKFISSDGEFFNNLVDYIRKNSELLKSAMVVEGNLNKFYYFDIENTSKFIGNGLIDNSISSNNNMYIKSKVLSTEININVGNSSFLDGDENYILENVFYKPFLRNIEKNVISGDYFDKSLFETNKTITGTNDFDGLLKLIRELKDKNENNCIVINPTVMTGIIDNITKESYLSEYLLNGTIEKVKIIETLECPNTKIVGVNPSKLFLILLPNLEIRKVSNYLSVNSVGAGNTIYQIYGFANGGDMFDTSIGFNI